MGPNQRMAFTNVNLSQYESISGELVKHFGQKMKKQIWQQKHLHPTTELKLFWADHEWAGL